MTAFTMNPADFAGAVAWAARFIPSKATHPILHGIKLDATENGLTLTATDNQAYAVYTASADVDEPGALLVPGRLLAAVAKNVGKTADVRFVCDGGKLNIAQGRAGSWSLPTLDVDDYPVMPDTGETTGQVDGEAFRAALARVLPAADRKAVAPMWGAVQLRTDGDALEVSASDTFRLAIAEVAWQPTLEDQPLDVRVPRELIDLATHAIGAEAAPVEIRQDGGTITFASPRARLTGRLVAHEWPRLRERLPKAPTHTATIVVDEFTAAVSRVLAVTDGRPGDLLMSHPVRLDISRERLGLSATIDENHATAECTISDYDDGDMFIGVNPAYLHDCLKTMGTDLAEVWIGPSNRAPLIFFPIDDDGKPVTTYRHIMMPVDPKNVETK